MPVKATRSSRHRSPFPLNDETLFQHHTPSLVLKGNVGHFATATNHPSVTDMLLVVDFTRESVLAKHASKAHDGGGIARIAELSPYGVRARKG
jgi:hypothetical protein